MPSHGKLRILAAYATLCVVWSSTWLVIKIGLVDLPPISYAAIRFVIAFPRARRGFCRTRAVAAKKTCGLDPVGVNRRAHVRDKLLAYFFGANCMFRRVLLRSCKPPFPSSE